MSRAARSISKPVTLSSLIALLASAALTTGCATASEKLAQRLRIGEPVSRVYIAKYPEVESALKMAMMKYPQRVDNTEAGIFETDYVKGEARFKPPHDSSEYSNGYRYRILLRLVKGKVEDRSSVKVQVVKQAELARDFFAQPEQVASDGLEENTILYRIGREITVARAVQRATEKANASSSNAE